MSPSGRTSEPPFIVGLGGTVRHGSTTELALRACLGFAAEMGARTRMFDGPQLADLPMYGAGRATPGARELVAALSNADGVVIASPGYHGTLSGMVKNALDYIEDLREAPRPYLTDLPVGVIVTGGGAQVLGPTVGTIRSVVHAIRGCPTPFAAAVKVDRQLFLNEQCVDPGVAEQLERVAEQVVRYARWLGAGGDVRGARIDGAFSRAS